MPAFTIRRESLHCSPRGLACREYSTRTNIKRRARCGARSTAQRHEPRDASEKQKVANSNAVRCVERQEAGGQKEVTAHEILVVQPNELPFDS